MPKKLNMEYKNGRPRIHTYQIPQEIETLHGALKEVKNTEGDLAEVGVYMGGTAEIIRQDIPDKPLYLFDTFTGLPDMLTKDLDSDTYYVGVCSAEKEIARQYLAPYQNIHIYKGIFPQKTGKHIKDKRFSFVHIDVDIYEATKDALEFFYPRVNIGGTILVHDYPAHPGVKKAVDDFMEGKGTFQHKRWQRYNKDPMITSGSRQILIKRRIPYEPRGNEKGLKSN